MSSEPYMHEAVRTFRVATWHLRKMAGPDDDRLSQSRLCIYGHNVDPVADLRYPFEIFATRAAAVKVGVEVVELRVSADGPGTFWPAERGKARKNFALNPATGAYQLRPEAVDKLRCALRGKARALGRDARRRQLAFQIRALRLQLLLAMTRLRLKLARPAR